MLLLFEITAPILFYEIIYNFSSMRTRTNKSINFLMRSFLKLRFDSSNSN